LIRVLRDEAGLKQEQAAALLDPHLVELTRNKSKAAIRTAISQFETGTRSNIPHHFRVAISIAFSIPLEWFTIPWTSEKAFLRALRKHRATGGATEVPTIAKIAATFKGVSLVAALPTADIDYDSVSRRPLLDRFRSELLAPRPGVLVVEGVSGYGKSSFVSLAINQLDRLQQQRLVLAVKCADRTTDHIIRSISDQVRIAEPRVDPEAPTALFEHVPTVVILDDADKIISPSEQGSAPVSGARLSELFATALLRRCNLKVVLIMRSANGPAATLYEELSGLTGLEPTLPFRLDPLSTEDVATLLHKKLKFANDMSTRFATQIGGDPLVVSTFVAIGSSRRAGRGRTLPWLDVVASSLSSEELPDAPERTREMRPLLDALQGRSRTAFLTAAVLTFAPASLDMLRCERLVALLSADRVVLAKDQKVPNDTVQAVIAEMLDDFTTTTSTQVDLHSRVKNTFRGLITESLGAEGLRKIHRRMAEAALEPAALVSTGPTPLNFAAYYTILHHIMAIYWLAPEASPEEILVKPKQMARDPSEKDLRELAELLSSAERLKDRNDIANVAFGALMLSKVDTNDGNGIIGRQFGDYERKLKMLTMFTREGLHENSGLTPLPELATPYTVQLLLDVAICASQAGLLEIARAAIASRPTFLKERASQHLARIRELFDARVEDEDPELGHLIQSYDADSEYLNVHNTVLTREGRLAEALEQIRNHADDAREMVELIYSRREAIARLRRRSRRPLARLLVASRRMLARRATLLVLDGDKAAATQWFGLAMQVDGLRKVATIHNEMPSLFPEHTNSLSGEAGRTFGTVYMHSGAEEDLDRVLEPIRVNIERAAEERRYYDQIDWLVLRSSLERLRGMPIEAAKTMKEAQKLRSRHNVNISFSATIIMSLEEERQRIRAKNWRGSSLKLEWLYKAAEGAGHELLACDAALMLAESEDEAEARHFWLTIASRTVKNGYGFRSIDLQRIEADGPFSDLL
jgi:hypothetical protein